MTLEDRVKGQLGELLMSTCSLMSQLEAAQTRVGQLETENQQLKAAAAAKPAGESDGKS